jgi:hypothetical protein
MPRGIETTSPTSSINPTDQTTLRGVSATLTQTQVNGPAPFRGWSATVPLTS